ncbi:hypothetical protein AKJ43_03475 [candidate division MSBL1 archaeon SCGC-AAA261D19]|uniref:Uncharacterized protein n=1 Tax=candidate division MSBL1 archaeon SCGC-AAA261D19 TaxID=1698273 RepID=A0A133V4F3_9EURY|nr:hypothetical protein AKJ43_03475 [candidate division MSBL1 archaeon SCGC-AAA261D19]
MSATILVVVTIALGWHLGIIWLERSFRSHWKECPLERLLRSAELDLLGMLRSELSHIVQTGGSHKEYYRFRLREANSWLKRIEDDGEPFA